MSGKALAVKVYSMEDIMGIEKIRADYVMAITDREQAKLACENAFKEWAQAELNYRNAATAYQRAEIVRYKAENAYNAAHVSLLVSGCDNAKKKGTT